MENLDPFSREKFIGERKRHSFALFCDIDRKKASKRTREEEEKIY